MKRIYFLVIIFVGFICTAYQCASDDCHKTIQFINNSQKEIYISPGSYPDTSFYYKFPNPNRNPNIYRVKPGERNGNGLWDWDCYEYNIAHNYVIIYVFDAEVLETIPWDTIGKYYMVLKTYHPTLEEMENNNWTITYTGE